MKKKMNRLFGFFLAFVLTFTVVRPVEIDAAGLKQTITFRAGDVGSFNLSSSNLKQSSKVGSNSVSKVEIKEKFIRLTVEKGTSIPKAIYDGFGYVISDTTGLYNFFAGALKTNSSYALLNDMKRWGLSDDDFAGKTDISQNKEFVLDYGKIVNPVPYTIRYLDAQSNEAIAAPVIVYGSAGDEITVSPIVINQYATTNQPVTHKLEKGQDNLITFYYAYTGTTYVPGNVITTPATPVTIPAATVATTGGLAAAGAAGAGAGAGAGAVGAGAGAGAGANIADNPTPAGANPDANVDNPENANGGENAEIDDNKTPKSAGIDDNNNNHEKKSSNFFMNNLVLIIVGIILLTSAFGIGAVIAVSKNKKN